MKHCRKSSEPEDLAVIRQQTPQLTWDELRDQHPSCYTSIRGALYSDQDTLCAYCERQVVAQDQQVAHFHPKSDRSTTRNWALEWENLWLACKGGTYPHALQQGAYLEPIAENRSCDEVKEDRIIDDEALSPWHVPSSPRIFTYLQSDNSMSLAPDKNGAITAGIEAAKINQTIDTFNLNCRRLVESRMRVYSSIESTIKKITSPSQRGRSVELFKQFAEHNLRKDNGALPEFFTMKRWRFGATAEEYLQSINFEG